MVMERKPEKTGVESKFIDWEQVKKMGSLGCTAQEVAHVLGFKSIQWLSDRCEKETGIRLRALLEEGLSHNKVNLRKKLWEKALTAGDTKMQIHMAENYLDHNKQETLSIDGSEKRLVINFGTKKKEDPDPSGGR